VGLIIFWASVSRPPSNNPPLAQGDRAAFAAAKREGDRKLRNATVPTFVASFAGLVLAVVSLCGLRSRVCVAIVMPGAILGILSAVSVFAIVVVYLLLAGMKF
jgi:hypothetical protein